MTKVETAQTLTDLREHCLHWIQRTDASDKCVKEGGCACEKLANDTLVGAVDLATEKGDHEEGDCYDEDTGDFLGSLTIESIIPGVDTGIPAQIAIFHKGYWYIFKPQSRYKEGEQDGAATQEKA